MNSWGEPIHCSRRGASHWRRQQPCQDASASGHGLSLDGLPVWVMAVADGHGGSRYRLSDRGSRLACERALALVQAAVSQRRLGAGDDEAIRAQWAAWLSRELPAAITTAWMAAIAADWNASKPEAAAAAGPAVQACEATTPTFQPLLYGSTLGLVLMTPRWWGQTGLGDWDLVRIDGDGQASLLSEEQQEIAAGEATCSLCQREAASLFAGRSGLWPIAAAAAPFALLLSTDGLRKSCASDPDFLLLASWLAGMPDAAEAPRGAQLAASLDRISREGSGDDVSVAIGRLESAPEQQAPALAAASPWADSAAATRTQPAARAKPEAGAQSTQAAGSGVVDQRAVSDAAPATPDRTSTSETAITSETALGIDRGAPTQPTTPAQTAWPTKAALSVEAAFTTEAAFSAETALATETAVAPEPAGSMATPESPGRSAAASVSAVLVSAASFSAGLVSAAAPSPAALGSGSGSGSMHQDAPTGSQQPSAPEPSLLRKPRAVAVLGLALLLAGVGVGATALLLPWPRSQPAKLATSTDQQALQQKARQLCSAPETISRQLKRRRTLIEQLRQQLHLQRPKPGWLQVEARRDPLAAWIAIGLDPALSVARRQQLLSLLGACPALIQALPAAQAPAQAPPESNKKAPGTGA